MVGADVFLGLSAKDVVSKEMVKSMSKNPIIFACANPDPEIKPELIKEVRSDAIIATGSSLYISSWMTAYYLYSVACCHISLCLTILQIRSSPHTENHPRDHWVG